MGLLSAVGNIIGAVGGDFISKGIDSIFGKATADNNYEYERRLQQHDQDFQKEMRATAYQTAVQDMQKAGINPAVAFATGSGDTYGGSSSHGTVAMQTPTGGNLAQNLSAINTTALTNAQKENIEADTKLKEKQSGKTEAETNLTKTTEKINRTMADAEIQLKNAQTKQQITQIRKETAEAIKQEYYNAYIAKYGHAPDADVMTKVGSKIEKAITDFSNWSGSQINTLIQKWL